MLILLGAVLLYKAFAGNQGGPEKLDVGALTAKIQRNEISKLTIKQSEALATDTNNRQWRTELSNPTIQSELAKMAWATDPTSNKPKVEKIEDQSSGNSMLWGILLTWAPILLFMGIWIFMLRQMQAGGNKALSFGKSRAKLL
ncbi:MAG TPA: hypothetical protein VGO96_15135, partial [Pyrinomonadaceae bacterium]|nr:hypothetical protein [Pyrinomonadaceae bacterium]